MAFDDLRSYALGSQQWFFSEGLNFTVPDPGGIVAVDALPDKLDPGWQPRFIGDVEDWSDKKNTDQEEVFKPKPGKLVRKDIVRFFQSLDMEITTNSLRRLAMQLMYGADVELDEDQGQFMPMSKIQTFGWLKMQRYTQNDQLVFAADLWVQLDVDTITSGNKKIVKPKYMAKLLDSDLNTMFFGDPTLLEAA